MSKKGRIVGIDFGMKRIGLALSDESRIIASPIKVILAEKKSEYTIKKVVVELEKLQAESKYEFIEIVVGMPFLMNGKMGLLGDEVRHFVELLKNATTIPIVTWDERLSSVQAERSMREANMNRRQRAKSVDEVAAVIILQSYLDHKSILENTL